MKTDNLKRKIFKSRLLLLAGLVILVLIAIPVVKESYRRYQIEQEIKSLGKEIGQLEQSNQELADLLEYYGKESFLEKEVKLKLNLAKPGEKVVIIKPGEEAPTEGRGSSTQSVGTKEQGDEEIFNPLKWWGYFFVND